ncbi:MAG TPA: D-hexose-6-phosphate mutarotase [Vicinamibacterales bacterium]|jgi:D-hexose-6-phosphate mutarotase|nr:D-hexose-6-phosphate mutarotase [Vicinamibacterales bacterium]
MSYLEELHRHDIPGHVSIVAGEAGLPKVVVHTDVSAAEIYLHGAHVTHFQKHGDEPLLFLSQRSGFGPRVPIRGGVPICHPWFGPRGDEPAHGLARLVDWRLAGTSAASDGSVTVRFALPSLGDEWGSLDTTFVVTISDVLTLTLTTTRTGGDAPLRVESCLHTYFHVGDVETITLAGLKDASFDDFAFGANGARRVEHDSALRIFQETNRVYPDNTSTVEIHDRSLGRIIRVEKSGSRSTVVWNPWTTQKMPDDFDQADYRRMVCVESGNVKQDATMLGPGDTTTLTVVARSVPIA